jgi:hypothetical protein
MKEQWKGQSGAYSRAYRILEAMAQAGHAKPARVNKKGKILQPGSVSEEMREFIQSLDSGDEERIKAHILKNIHHLRGKYRDSLTPSDERKLYERQ